MSDCKVCLVEHQPDIHNATLSVHRWLKDRIRRSLEPPATPTPPAEAKPVIAEAKPLRRGRDNVSGAA